MDHSKKVLRNEKKLIYHDFMIGISATFAVVTLALQKGGGGQTEAYIPWSPVTAMTATATSTVIVTAGSPGQVETQATDFDVWRSDLGNEQSWPGASEVSISGNYPEGFGVQYCESCGWCGWLDTGSMVRSRDLVFRVEGSNISYGIITWTFDDETPWYAIQDSSVTKVTNITP